MEKSQIVYQRNNDYIFRKIVNETILVPIQQDVSDMDGIYAMNDVASTLWDRLENPATSQELAQALLEEYDAPREVIAQDVERFLEDLLNIGALKVI